MAQMRDCKGRFCKATTNTNKKENDIMMNNKMKEQRMATLMENGINVDNFFDLNMRIPFGAEVKISVNGKEMTVGMPSNESGNLGCDVDLAGLDFVDDEIAKDIIENGYVKNTKLFRRWITAHTFKLLNYEAWRNPNRKGWECGVKDLYDYNYQFTMMLEEMRVLAILQKEDPEAFLERSRFFNGDVVLSTLIDYKHRLKKYITKARREKTRMCKGKEFVRLAKYGDVYVSDLNSRVFEVIEHYIGEVKDAINTGDYEHIYYNLKLFMQNAYNKLPHETTKCSKWKDAFKAVGATETLKNLIRFHEVVIPGCTNKYDSERRLYELLDLYNGEEWRLHKLLVDVIEYNNFDLRKSIASGHNAPGTSVDRRWKGIK